MEPADFNARAIAAWDAEGGALQAADPALFGTDHQIAWGEQIRQSLGAEFDRVAHALERASHAGRDTARVNARLALLILEDLRSSVMAHREAGYFIHDWQELDGAVRRLITADPRYQAIAANRITAAGLQEAA